MFNTLTLKKEIPFWLSLFLILTLECFFISYKFNKDILPFYPVGYDQTSYLMMAYSTYQNIKTLGIIEGLRHSSLLANGILFPLQAVACFFIFGLTRFNALLPNIFYFLLLQIITISVIRNKTRNIYLSFLMIGMILMVKSPFVLTGSIYDFRMENMAFSLFGIFIACVIQSDFFLNRTWSLIAALVGSVLILSRAITITYFLGIMGCMILYLFFSARMALHSNNKFLLRKKLYNALFIFSFFFVLAFIYIILNREALYSYYVVGHVISNEKSIRAVEVGIKNYFQLWLYYPYILFRLQIGPYGSYILLSLTALSIYLNKKSAHFRSITSPLEANKLLYWREGLIFLIICLLIPLFILTMDSSKSPLVSSVTIMAVLWLTLWLFIRTDSQLSLLKNSSLFKVITIGVFLLGCANFTRESLQQRKDSNHEDLVVISQMYDDIGKYVQEHHWSSIIMSTDRVVDYLLHTNIVIPAYEKDPKVLLNAQSTELGGTIFSSSKDTLLQALARSNIVIFNISNNYPEKSPYPADLQIAKYKSELLAYTEQNYTHFNDYHFKNATYRVYIKSNITDESSTT